ASHTPAALPPAASSSAPPALNPTAFTWPPRVSGLPITFGGSALAAPSPARFQPGPLRTLLPPPFSPPPPSASPGWVSGRPTGLPVAASHSRAVPSSLPVAIVRPSPLKATDVTRPLWRSASPTGSPVAAFQRRAV